MSPAPSESWADVAQTEIDPFSPLKATVFDKTRENLIHVREVAYDPATHTPITAHDHDGLNSALIISPDVPNLVRDCQPSVNGNDSLDDWGGIRVTNQGLEFAGASGRATTFLGQRDGNSRFMYGTGCDLVLAFLARATEPMGNLTLNFGIVDGNTSTFGAGFRAVVTQDTISVGRFQRYYTIIPPATVAGIASFSNSCRFGITTSDSFNPSSARVHVTCIVAKPCTVLPWFEPAHRTTRQHNWELIGMGDVPVWDQEANFVNALFCAPS